MMNGRDRPRPPATNDARRGADPRNGSGSGSGDGSMSRAEKFEDEKKRIIQSCYSKKDNDGTLIESYITHVRITEDAAHPSTPAPPDSAPANKKPRVIIVSVRRSGRVRMHKARENNDGTFSIGKTWMLDDLTGIQSYSAFVPKSQVEQQHKEWAGSVGFIISVGKPYYWHARSSKEKEFFIGSLVKIYKKYTGGKVPNLIGFDERERQLLVGSTSPSASSGPAPPGSRGGPESSTDIPTQPQHQPPPQASIGRDPSRDGAREVRRRPSEDPVLRSQKSREQMSRPSTASKPAPSPFGPPQNLPPLVPPPRAEPKRELPTTFLHTGDEPNQGRAQDEPRPPSSREGRGAIPPSLLAARAPEPRPLEPKRSTDALRPTTPGSFTSETRGISASPGSGIGQKSPYRDAPEKPSAVAQEPAPEAITAPTVAPEIPKPAPPPEIEPPTPTPISEPEVVASTAAAEETSEPSAAEAGVSKDATPTTTPTQAADEDNEAHRPGLGPMIKKKSTKDIASAFRKAATTYGAFKPRPGGAGERLLAAAKKQQAEAMGPDGITGVVPAPSRSVNDLPKTSVDDTAERETSVASPASAPPATTNSQPVTPTVEVTQHPVDDSLLPSEPAPGAAEAKDSLSELTKVESHTRSPSPSTQSRRRKRREDHTIKYCQSLGIDPSVLDGRGIDFDDILTELGWNGRLGDEQKIEDLEADVRREIGRVEATSWLGNLEQQEGKVEQLAVLIDKTIEECEELDGLLTLYSHELNTLHEDVAYIEAQSQGLQVQTANQKLLQNELQTLLKTLSISPSDIRPLREASLTNPDGLKEAETALSTLYKAMLMIDADIGQNKKRQAHASVGVYANTEIGQMRAIKERKGEYRQAALTFLQRLKPFMTVALKTAEQKRADTVVGSPRDPLKLDGSARQKFREEVWRYNPLMLFAKEVSTSEWHDLVQLYEQQSKPSYQNDFRDNTLAWKKAARKPTGEEQELLFTHQEKEKEGEGITMAARKLTVRRGKTIRAATGLRLASSEKKPTSKVEPCEAFASSLRETLHMITDEQNFVVQFFHLDSLATADFSDLVAAASLEDRQCPDFTVKHSPDPDRQTAKRVEQIMDEIYSFWPNDLQSMVDWAVQADPMQGIGILFALESAMTELDDTNQEFITHSLQKVHARLMGLFNRFVDEQIRGIEDTKVKVNKRKGVISFMRVFPNFSTAVENMLANSVAETCEIRVSVNDAYDRINRAMWESLKFIAKEAPGQLPGVAASAGDPEDKEVLNYHILLIENMNHYVEEVDVHSLPVLERWADRARQDFDEHMKLYLDAVIYRPLGKLLDFIQSIETLQANGSPGEIATRASHSRIVAKKVLSSYDAKEIKRGVEMLKKRVEKHFGDADDPGLSRSLVLKVLRECELRYENVWDRTRHIIDTVYEGQLEMDWRKEDAVTMFRK
ncbi:putative Exocyst complex component Sec3 [Penicillium brasilianum]|uniref:Putative Exocyst complex component Sec3 n=1 Tax=Penicillium brasilianum TaxID=104259 RepID=A0A1S9RTD3_PENBI|nr:putative Exocyst complex component Sec3 [Penicillium brasilianum]